MMLQLQNIFSFAAIFIYNLLILGIACGYWSRFFSVSTECYYNLLILVWS